MLHDLGRESIHLNHWDTGNIGGQRWSLSIPWCAGEQIPTFRRIANFHYSLCEPAWRQDILWSPLADSLFADVQQQVNPKRYGCNFQDLEDAFSEQLFEIHHLLGTVSSAVMDGKPVDTKRIAGILGNFHLSIRRRLCRNIEQRTGKRSVKLAFTTAMDNLAIADCDDINSTIIGIETSQAVSDLIRPTIVGMSPVDRTIFTMHLERTPVREVAKQVGKTEDNIKVMTHRMRGEIANALKGGSLSRIDMQQVDIVDIIRTEINLTETHAAFNEPR